MRVRLSALLLAAVASVGVLGQTGPSAGAAEDPAGRVKAAQASLASFNALATQLAAELTAVTASYEQAQARADAARAKATTLRAGAGSAQTESAQARQELAAVVLRNFKNPPRSSLATVLSTGRDGLAEAVLAAHDQEVLEGNQRDLLRRAESSRVAAEGLVVGAEQAETEAAAAEKDAAAQQAEATRVAEANQARLQRASVELEKAMAAKAAYDAEQARLREIARQKALAAAARAKAARDAAAAAAAQRDADRNRAISVPSFGGGGGGAGCSGAPTSGYPNGFIPASALCSIGGGHRLRADAAAAFKRMDAAYPFAGGLCVTDSYRSYAEQVDVYRRKPSLAAVPGNSNHGRGVAIDFCGGINRFGSAAHEWMVNNAERFGWWHPFWARQGGSKPEAWHWEYRG